MPLRPDAPGVKKVPLALPKTWPYKKRDHVIENIGDWPEKSERMQALEGVGLLATQTIIVYDGAMWWLPLPAYFALVGSSAFPSTVLMPNETPGGTRIENPTLDPVSQANWRLRMKEAKFQAGQLAAALLQDSVKNFVDERKRLWEGLRMSEPLNETDQVAELRRMAADLSADRTDEKVKAAYQALGAVYKPRAPELLRAASDLFLVLVS